MLHTFLFPRSVGVSVSGRGWGGLVCGCALLLCWTTRHPPASRVAQGTVRFDVFREQLHLLLWVALVAILVHVLEALRQEHRLDADGHLGLCLRVDDLCLLDDVILRIRWGCHQIVGQVEEKQTTSRPDFVCKLATRTERRNVGSVFQFG